LGRFTGSRDNRVRIATARLPELPRLTTLLNMERARSNRPWPCYYLGLANQTLLFSQPKCSNCGTDIGGMFSVKSFNADAKFTPVANSIQFFLPPNTLKAIVTLPIKTNRVIGIILFF